MNENDWYEFVHSNYKLTIKDIQELKHGDELELLILDRNVWDVALDESRNTQGQLYNPKEFFKRNKGRYIHDKDLQGTLILYEGYENIKLYDTSLFEFHIEYMNKHWYPLENGTLSAVNDFFYPLPIARQYICNSFNNFPNGSYVEWTYIEHNETCNLLCYKDDNIFCKVKFISYYDVVDCGDMIEEDGRKTIEMVHHIKDRYQRVEFDKPSDTPWTMFSLGNYFIISLNYEKYIDTGVGYRGPMVLWSKLDELPQIYWE